VFSAKSTHEKNAYPTPTLHLPWRRPRREGGKRPDTQAGRRNERRRRNMKEKKGDKTERKQKEKNRNRKREQKEKHLP
jgi:hypothetical protein